MSERPPSFEPEFSAEELKVIGLLKERGFENAETREAYDAWFENEKKISDEKAAHGEITTANVEFQLKVGAIKEAAGFLDAAAEAYYDAVYMADQNDAPEELRAKVEAALNRVQTM